MLVLALMIAFAPAEAAARESYDLGRAFYDEGAFDDAMHAFEHARARVPLPGFLFNIGQCHMQMRRYEKAIEMYQRFLDEAPEAAQRALVLSLIDEARAALRRPASPKKIRAVATAEQSRGVTVVDEDRTWIWIGVTSSALVAITGAAVLYQATH